MLNPYNNPARRLLLPIFYAEGKKRPSEILNPAPCLRQGGADSQQNVNSLQPTLHLSAKASFACRTQEMQ